MRTCRRADSLSFLAAYGEASPLQRVRHRLHLRVCKVCALRQVALVTEKAGLARALSISLSDEATTVRLRSAISQRIRTEPCAAHVKQSHAISRRTVVFASLALALFLALGLTAMRRTGPGAHFERWWRTHILHQADCDTPTPYLRTPPGGTESTGAVQ